MSRKERTGVALQVLWLASACGSGGFDLAGAPAKLAFTVQPTTSSAHVALGAVVVTVEDAFGRAVATASHTITLGLEANAAGAPLSGTTTVAAVGGVATFSNVTVDAPGTGYTLTADGSGLTGATSVPFDVTPAPPVPTKLGFSAQPSTTLVGHAIQPPVQALVLDEYGNVVTSASASITLAIGTNAAAGTLSGTTIMTTVSGVATFSDLSLDKPGSGYTLTASAPGLAGATSIPFDVIDWVAAVTVTPLAPAVNAGAPITLTATTFDAAGYVLTGRTVTWSSSDWRVVYLMYDVTGGEVVCGLAPGSAAITATSEGKSGAAVVTVAGASSPGCCYAGC